MPVSIAFRQIKDTVKNLFLDILGKKEGATRGVL